MPKMVCVNCQTELKIETNGVYVIEMFADPPRPYKIWDADLWKCKGCGQEIISGFGNGALAEHYMEGFQVLYEKVLAGKHPVFFDYEKPFVIQEEKTDAEPKEQTQ